MTQNPILYYDSVCGLCQKWVQILLSSPQGGSFLFAPLGGQTFKIRLPENLGTDLPESMVLETPEGAFLFRSDVVIWIFKTLGGHYQVYALLLKLIPKWIRDRGYDLVAKLRYPIFGKKPDLCPLLPMDIQKRFLP